MSTMIVTDHNRAMVKKFYLIFAENIKTIEEKKLHGFVNFQLKIHQGSIQEIDDTITRKTR